MEKGMGVMTGLKRLGVLPLGGAMALRGRSLIALLATLVLAVGLWGCGADRTMAPQALLSPDDAPTATNVLVGPLTEVSPPEAVQTLKPFLDVYEPQVRILTPEDRAVLTQTTVAVQIRVRDLPIYKDANLGLGPHVHLFLDDQPAQAIYDPDIPIVFDDLAPGTHTLRAVAVRPWDESFKNEGAFDQVSFDVFTSTPVHRVDGSAPLLTYNNPQGRYGAEPILLDFHLINAPLHLVAKGDEAMGQDRPQGAISDWRIRCTVNGNSFIFDRWQPIYLQGFKPGENWVKLELIDETGQRIDNAFNTAVRVIDYEPGGEDGLSQLIRGEISLAQARVLVDPNYTPPVSEPEENGAPEDQSDDNLEEKEPQELETAGRDLETPEDPESPTSKAPEVPVEVTPDLPLTRGDESESPAPANSPEALEPIDPVDPEKTMDLENTAEDESGLNLLKDLLTPAGKALSGEDVPGEALPGTSPAPTAEFKGPEGDTETNPLPLDVDLETEAAPEI